MTQDPNLVYESPAPFVDIVTIFAILVVGPVGITKIIVERDCFTIIDRRFLLPFFTRVYTFPFASIKEIEAWLLLTQMKEIGYNVDDLSQQPLPGPSRYTSNTLIVRFKNGHEVTLTPAIYRGAFHKALGHIRDLSAIHVTMNDRAQ
jgi:hypothetical protein